MKGKERWGQNFLTLNIPSVANVLCSLIASSCLESWLLHTKTIQLYSTICMINMSINSSRFDTENLNKRAMALYTCVDKGNKSATGFWQPLMPLQPLNSLGDQLWPQILNQWPKLPTSPCAYCILYMVWALSAASEATTTSKQPQRSNLTSDLKSVTPITYISMCILLIWYGTFWQPPRSLQPPSSLGGHVWPQISNQWPQLHMLPCLWMLQLALFC